MLVSASLTIFTQEMYKLGKSTLVGVLSSAKFGPLMHDLKINIGTLLSILGVQVLASIASIGDSIS